MKSTNQTLEMMDNQMNQAISHGAIHLYTDPVDYHGRHIQINGQTLLNFGSCSYLGLETHDALKQAAKAAIDKYGMQWSSSRSYISCALYAELEALLAELFSAPVLVATSTTSAHLSALPTLVGDNDVVLVDQQAHASMQMATNLLKARGIVIEILPHNNMAYLEKKLVKYQQANIGKIWYLADGVYSMYGDTVPLQPLCELMDKYSRLHAYLDDAHGVSWCGRQGRGYVLGNMDIREQMFVTVSFSKSFGVSGGGLIGFHQHQIDKISRCGGTMVFSGPMQPSNLAALIESVKIHLSPEIIRLQQQLSDKSHYFNTLCEQYELPLIKASDVPLKYIGLGMHSVMYNLVQRLFKDGIYVNLGMFPAVRMKGAGLRCALNNHLTYEDLEKLAKRIHFHLPQAFKEADRTTMDVLQFFSEFPISDSFRQQALHCEQVAKKEQDNLTLSHVQSISDIDQDEWDGIFQHRGSFSWQGLSCLEKIFQQQQMVENNWSFHYFIVRDQHQRIVVATFFTEVVIKQDMFSSADISREIELTYRQDDPYYLTAKVMMMGSMLTEGSHLYIDYGQARWLHGIHLLLDKVREIQQQQGISDMILRDFDAGDKVLEKTFGDQGFVKVGYPDSHEITGLEQHSSIENYFHSAINSQKRYQLRHMFKDLEAFEVDIFNHQRPVTAMLSQQLDQLYQNVARGSYEINSFILPENMFITLAASPEWELVVLRLKEAEPSAAPAAFYIANYSTEAYNPIIAGLDYQYVASHGVYRQLLWHVLDRAKKHQLKTIHLGFAASIEKRRFGAKSKPMCCYVQLDDTLAMERLNAIVISSSSHVEQKWKQSRN